MDGKRKAELLREIRGGFALNAPILVRVGTEGDGPEHTVERTSSLITPLEFDRCVLPHGVTTAICDPHEIANVLGSEGIRYFLDCAERTIMPAVDPTRIRFQPVRPRVPITTAEPRPSRSRQARSKEGESARRRAMRSSIGGCVEKSVVVPRSGPAAGAGGAGRGERDQRGIEGQRAERLAGEPDRSVVGRRGDGAGHSARPVGGEAHDDSRHPPPRPIDDALLTALKRKP